MPDTTKSAPSVDADELDKLIAIADKAKLRAYAPYSNFRVGAALLSTDNEIYSGCNVENSSYGLTICAERTALFTAVSSGACSFKAIVVTTDLSEDFSYPCGACRQVLSEFGDFDVFCMKATGQVHRTTLHELIPFCFSKAALETAEKQRLEKEEE